MDEEFGSFVVTDPDLVDEGIDISGLRTETDVNPYLLGEVAPGIKYEGIGYSPTAIQDLVRYFRFGLPAIDTSAAAPPATGGGGGGSGDGGQATLPGFESQIPEPINTPEEQRLIDEGIGVQIGPGDPVVAPGEMPVTQEEMDAFNQIPVTPVGGQPIDPTGMLPQIPEVIAQDPTTMIPQLGSISPTFAEGTATLEDAGGTYPIIGDDIGVLQSAEGGLGEEDQFVQNEDLIDRGNPLGDSRIVPEEQETQGVPKTTFGTPVDFDQGFIDAKDFSATGTLADPLEKDDVLSGADVADPKGFLNRIGLKGFDPAEAFVKTAINASIGKPVTLFLDILKGLLPEQDPRVGMLDDFYTTGKGAEYMDPSSPNYIPGMENYNVVSGGLLNTLTGGKYGEPTTYGLQEAYQDRIDTIENTLKTKYNMTAEDIAAVKAGTYTNEEDIETDLLQRLVDLENAKAAEKKRLDLFAGDPEGDQPGMTIAENIALQNRAKAEADAIRLKNLTGDVDFDVTPTTTGVNPFDTDDFDTGVGEFDTTPVDKTPTIKLGPKELGDDLGTLGDDLSAELFDVDPSTNIIDNLYADSGTIMSDATIVDDSPSPPQDTGGGQGGGADMGTAPKGGTYDAEAEDDEYEAPDPTPTEDFYQDPITTGGQGDKGDPGGSRKIVCTMMNESYGFGSFRNKIWMKFHKDLSPEYQRGYHKLFLPLVRIAKKNIIVKKVLEHIAVHSTIDMRQSMRGKTHLLGRVYRKILLPLCYWVGKNG